MVGNISKVWIRIHSGGIYNVEFLKAYLYNLSNTWQIHPKFLSRSPSTEINADVTGNFLSPCSGNTICISSLNFYKNLCFFGNMPDSLTNRWHSDISVTRFVNLEQIYMENICPWHGIAQDRTYNRWFSDMFLGAWDSFNLKRENSWNENFQSRSSWNLQDEAKRSQNR